MTRRQNNIRTQSATADAERDAVIERQRKLRVKCAAYWSQPYSSADNRALEPCYTFDFAVEYCKSPGGRFARSGEASGEHFRERFLVPMLQTYEEVYLDLTTTESFNNDFIKEAFEEGVKIYGPDFQRRIKVEDIVASRPGYFASTHDKNNVLRVREALSTTIDYLAYWAGDTWEEDIQCKGWPDPMSRPLPSKVVAP